jgi:hypothetical protein
MTDVAAPPKTVLEIVLEWSRDRLAWQRDALRRIVQSQQLNETDISELVTLCKRGRMEKPLPSDPQPKPLEANHLPANPGAGAAVALIAVKDVSAVNNLAPGQTLSFAPAGITVVYGDNGAGKSGYVRILKRACRARHSEVILPNVYGEPATKTASATLCYSVGGKEQPPATWTDTGKPEPQPHPILSAISVFDADSAVVHVKGKNEVAFRPFGLDIPDELGNACKQVKAVLEAEKKQLEATRNGIFPIPPIDRNTTTAIAQEAVRNRVFGAPSWSATTEVGKALAGLTYTTDPATLEKLATLSPQEQARLNRLTEDLSKTPVTAAAEQKLKADRIKRLADALALIAAQTTEDALSNLLALQRSAAAKRGAARLAAQHLFGTDLLPEVGGEVWRTLWEAARRYSTEAAYPTAPFPPTAPDTLCVLCQQPLSADALQRMKRFEFFIRDDTERQAQEEEVKFETDTRALTQLAISLRPVVDSIKELELHDKALARAVRRALASARLRRYMALRRAAGHDETAIPPAEPFPSAHLAALESQIRKYSADLQNAATGEERRVLEAEQQELADRAAHPHAGP